MLKRKKHHTHKNSPKSSLPLPISEGKLTLPSWKLTVEELAVIRYPSDYNLALHKKFPIDRKCASQQTWISGLLIVMFPIAN